MTSRDISHSTTVPGGEMSPQRSASLMAGRAAPPNTSQYCRLWRTLEDRSDPPPRTELRHASVRAGDADARAVVARRDHAIERDRARFISTSQWAVTRSTGDAPRDLTQIPQERGAILGKASTARTGDRCSGRTRGQATGGARS